MANNAADQLAQVLAALIDQTRRPAPSYDSVDHWWPIFRQARHAWSEPIDQALIGGATADRVGYAFAAGYQAALRRMDPGLPEDRICCLSVTEEGGGHPRVVQSTFTPIASGSAYCLNGRKKWATLSSAGGVALVVASTGTDAEGRNQLRVARVDLGSPGVQVVPMPPTAFVPEIQHCRLEFDDVRVQANQFLLGDGYTRYVRPFRTLEDTHVGAGILAYVLAIAFRYDWARELREQLMQLIVTLRSLALTDPSAPAVHVALEGFFHIRDDVLKRCEPCWQQVDDDVRRRWERDAALTSIAGNVRAQRARKAWERLAPKQG
jgi:hypothetical protein